MSIKFEGLGTKSIKLGALDYTFPSNLIVSYPFTLSCWFFPTNSTVEQSIFVLGNGVDYWWISLAGNVAGDPIRAQTWNGSSSTEAAISNVVRFNQWNCVTARFVSNTQRVIAINGSAGTANITDSTQGAPVIKNLWIGGDAVTDRGLRGYIAHAAIWNEQIVNADNATLGRGASPLFIRRQNLVAYWPLVNPGPQYNIADAKSRTSFPLPLKDNGAYSNWNPPVKTVLPTARIYRLPSSVVSGNNVPVLYHQRQQQGMAS